MTKTDDPFAPDPRIRSAVEPILNERGFDPATIEALLRFDVSHFHWRRMYDRHAFVAMMMAEVSEPLDNALFQGLIAVARIESGIGRASPAEPTIGLVAEVLDIDPSRASRIVSELVKREVVERHASKEDSRRTVLTLTAKGRQMLTEFMSAKWDLLARVFDGWEPEEVRQFSHLFERYIAAMRDVTGTAAQSSE